MNDIETLAKTISDFVEAMTKREKQVADQIREIHEDIAFIKSALNWQKEPRPPQ